MPIAHADGQLIRYEIQGEPGGQHLLLIGPLGTLLEDWPTAFVEGAIARQCRLIRADFRDAAWTGLWAKYGDPDILAMIADVQAGKPIPAPPYSIDDLAGDFAALLEELDIPAAHVVAAGSGGAVAQLLAALHGPRVASLTLVAGSTGAPTLPPASADVTSTMRQVPANIWDKRQIVAKKLKLALLVQGSGFRDLPAQIKAKLEAAFDRYHNPPANHRQTWALLADGDRTNRCRAITVPTLIVQGSADPVIPPAHGRALKAAIAGARLRVIEGLGHVITEAASDTILGEVMGFIGPLPRRTVSASATLKD